MTAETFREILGRRPFEPFRVEVKLVERMLAQLDARNDLSPAEKAGFRAELAKLAKDIAEGRRRFGDE